jgi:hypothetical protein
MLPTLHGSTTLKPYLLSRPGGPARQMLAQSGRTGTSYRKEGERRRRGTGERAQLIGPFLEMLFDNA